MLSLELIANVSPYGIHSPCTFNFFSFLSDLIGLLSLMSQILKDSLLTVNKVLLSFHLKESAVVSCPPLKSMDLVNPPISSYAHNLKVI